MRLNRDNLWKFSIHYYAREKIADACLRLQNECGADVNLILFILWMSAREELLSAAQLRLAVRATAPWQRTVVVGLRRVRCNSAHLLKSLPRKRQASFR